jgi:hypothetical protein
MYIFDISLLCNAQYVSYSFINLRGRVASYTQTQHFVILDYLYFNIQLVIKLQRIHSNDSKSDCVNMATILDSEFRLLVQMYWRQDEVVRFNDTFTLNVCSPLT